MTKNTKILNPRNYNVMIKLASTYISKGGIFHSAGPEDDAELHHESKIREEVRDNKAN